MKTTENQAKSVYKTALNVYIKNMANISFSVLNLLELDLKKHDSLELTCVSGRMGLSNKILEPNINRPGLALSGFFDSFANERVQLFGRGEYAYLATLTEKKDLSTIEKMFSFKIPCCLFSNDLKPPKEFLEISDKHNCPILTSTLSSNELALRLLRILSNTFAPRISLHGVLVEVFGLGILIMGSSASEKANSP